MELTSVFNFTAAVTRVGASTRIKVGRRRWTSRVSRELTKTSGPPLSAWKKIRQNGLDVEGNWSFLSLTFNAAWWEETGKKKEAQTNRKTACLLAGGSVLRRCACIGRCEAKREPCCWCCAMMMMMMMLMLWRGNLPFCCGFRHPSPFTLKMWFPLPHSLGRNGVCFYFFFTLRCLVNEARASRPSSCAHNILHASFRWRESSPHPAGGSPPL